MAAAFPSIYGTAPKPKPRAYNPPSSSPFPEGRIFILLSQNKQYMGKDAPLSENKGLPVVRVKATVHVETAQDIAHRKLGNKIGWIEAWDVQVCRKTAPELGVMAKTLFDKTGWFKAELIKPHMQFQPFGDVLFIDTVHILPAYRGHGLGLLALRYFLDHIYSFRTDLAILPIVPDPAAAEWQSKTPSKKTQPSIKADKKAQIKRLLTYWGYLGFEQWSSEAQNAKTGVPYMGLSMREFHFPARKILPHFFERPLYYTAYASTSNVTPPSQPLPELASSAARDQSVQAKPKKEIVIPKMDFGALLDGSMSFDSIAPVPPPRTYPRGYLYVTLNKRKIYMGTDETLNSYPIEPLNAKIRYETQPKSNISLSRIVGKIDGIMVRRESFTHEGQKLHDVLASHSKQLAKFGRAVFDDEGKFAPFGPLSEAIVPHRLQYDFGDILIIQDMQLKKRYRGFNIGLLAIWHLLKMIPSFEQDVAFLQFPKSTPQKLKEHFKALGWGPWLFDRPIGDCTYWGVRQVHTNIGQIAPLGLIPRPQSVESENQDDASDSEDDEMDDGMLTEGEFLLKAARDYAGISKETYIDMQEQIEATMDEVFFMRMVRGQLPNWA